MDPLAAFGLAAGILQVVGFSLELLSKASQIRKEGSTVTAADCNTVADHLREQCQRLQTLKAEANAAAPAGQLQTETATMKKLSDETVAIANDICSTLAGFQPQAGDSRWDSFRRVIVSLWNDSKVKAKSERLVAMRQELLFEVVVSMKGKVDNLDLSSQPSALLDPATKQTIEALDKELKAQMAAMSDQLRRQDEKATERHAESMQTLQSQEQLAEGRHESSMAVAVDHHERNMAAHLDTLAVIREIPSRLRTPSPMPDGLSVLVKLKNRLWFPSMSDRYDDIDQQHKNTLEWLFTGAKKEGSSSSTFVEWVKSGTGMYWVSGKAGCGKSTMMKFLADDRRTRAHLEAWASTGGRRLVIATFYFWILHPPTSPLLKSLNGLLQSVLYSIINQEPAFAPLLFPDQHTLGRDWGDFPTIFDLKRAVRRLIDLESPPAAVALLIDGLDEYEATSNEHEDVANMLRNAANATHLKIMVSSRPEDAFERAFVECDRLRFQELTADDRMKVVVETLGAHDKIGKLRKEKPDEVVALFELIVERSEGIFLWVTVVLLSIIDELEETPKPNLKAIEDIVEKCPTELASLFGHILLKRITPRRRVEAAKLLLIMRAENWARSYDLPWAETSRKRGYGAGMLGLTLSFFEDPLEAVIGSSPSLISADELAERLQSLNVKLRRSTVGLLEMHNPLNTAEQTKPEPHHVVGFLHRSVLEYLVSDEAQMHLRETLTEMTAFNPNMTLMKCLLGTLKAIPANDRDFSKFDYSSHFGWVQESLILCRPVEKQFPNESEAILDDVDRVMTHYRQMTDPSHFEWRTWSGESSPFWNDVLEGLADAEALEHTSTNSNGSIKGELHAHWSDFLPLDETHLRFSKHFPEYPLGGDFLSLAIDYGLHTYIETKLRKDASKLAKRTARPLLNSACQPGPTWWLLKGAIRSDTTRLLLSHGSDPNEPFRGLTPWQHALHLARECYVLPLHDRQEVASILRLMIQHGADLDARVKWTAERKISGHNYGADQFDLSVEELIRRVFTRDDSGPPPGLIGFKSYVTSFADVDTINLYDPDRWAENMLERPEDMTAWNINWEATGSELLELLREKRKSKVSVLPWRGKKNDEAQGAASGSKVNHSHESSGIHRKMVMGARRLRERLTGKRRE